MTDEYYIAELNIKAQKRFELIMANSENAIKALWEVCALISPLEPDREVDAYLADFANTEDAVHEACFKITIIEWKAEQAKGQSERI